ncbi:unnamed protein product, partial [Heterosigma akashiwo]
TPSPTGADRWCLYDYPIKDTSLGYKASYVDGNTQVSLTQSAAASQGQAVIGKTFVEDIGLSASEFNVAASFSLLMEGSDCHDEAERFVFTWGTSTECVTSNSGD